MFRRKLKNKISISIIACGEVGRKISTKIIEELKDLGVDVRSLLITTNLTNSKGNFNFYYKLENNADSYAKNIEKGIKNLENDKDKHLGYLKKIFTTKKEDMLFVITGAGGTGIAATTKTLELLETEFNSIPPVILLLPELFENSRVQYNTSKFIYETVYKNGNRGNSLLVIDNNPILEELEAPFSDIADNRINFFPLTFANLLYGSTLKNAHSDYDGNFEGLKEVLYTPGIALLIEQPLSVLENDKYIINTRFNAIVANKVINLTSLNHEDVFSAKNAFILLSDTDYLKGKNKINNDTNFQIKFEADKLQKSFYNKRPIIKFIDTYDDKNELPPIPKIHALITGISEPPRLIKTMKIGRDSKKSILRKENIINNSETNLDIDKILELEKKIE